MSLQYNDAAERILTGVGFECEPEPDWVSGRVPDFYCTGKATIWVEVKSLDEPDEIKNTGREIVLFRERVRAMRNCGKAFAVVSDDMSQRDAKLALVIADKALAEMATKDPRPHRVFVVIPRDPEYGRYVRVEAWSGDGLEVYHCCRSASGRYGRPNLGGEITEPVLQYRYDALLLAFGHTFGLAFGPGLRLELTDQR